MDGGAWKAAVHGVTMSQTRLSDFTSLHVRPLEQDRKPRNKLMHLWVPYFLTEEARIYNGANTASSINGAGKTGQLHVKELN